MLIPTEKRATPSPLKNQISPTIKKKDLISPLSLFEICIKYVAGNNSLHQTIFVLPIDILELILTELEKKNRLDFWVLLGLFTSGRYISTFSFHISKPINDVFSILQKNLFPFQFNIKELTHIDLSSCSEIEDFVIEEFSKNFPSITIWNLSDCSKLTKKSLDSISKYNSQSLEHLNISWCYKIEGDAIVCVSQACSKLTHLDISRITKLYDRHLEQILIARKLEFLNISHCDKLTYRILDYLRTSNSIKEIHMLNIGNKDKIWNLKFEEFSSICTNLSNLRLSYINISSKSLSLIAKRCPLTSLFLLHISSLDAVELEISNNFFVLELIFCEFPSLSVSSNSLIEMKLAICRCTKFVITLNLKNLERIVTEKCLHRFRKTSTSIFSNELIEPIEHLKQIIKEIEDKSPLCKEIIQQNCNIGIMDYF